MPNPFFNTAEHRIRALWRILIQGAIFFLGQTLLGIVIGLVTALVVLLSRNYSPEMLTAPGLFGSILLRVVTTSPIIRVITPLISLGTILFSFWFAGKVTDHRSFKDFGFHWSRQWWQDMAFGLALGALLMVLIFAVELAMGWVTVTTYFENQMTQTSFVIGMLESLLLFVCVGIYEEMLARGYQLRNLAEGLNFTKLGGARGGLILAYLLSSSMFGLYHLANANTTWISTLNLIIAGLFLGLGYVLTGDLAISIGLHITWNFFQGCVFGFPVSGGGAGVSFIGIQQGGPVLLTGGAFGPEAGLVGIGAIFIGCAVILWYVKSSRGSLSLHDRLASYEPVKCIEPVGQPVQEPVPAD